MSLSVSSAGDVGDVVMLINILKELPDGPHTLVLEASPLTKSKGQEGVERLLSLIGPLANSQPYIKECRLSQSTDEIDWKSAEFRSHHFERGETLMQAHLNHLIKTKGIGHGIMGNKPWLKVVPSKVSKNRIVINRTDRYRNPFFRWTEIVKKYGDKLMFIGLHHEWEAFCNSFGKVPYHETKNMLEVAQVIAGSELFIGNQSCCNAIAEGLKHNMIQETSLKVPDCVWIRPNAQHVYNGKMTLPGFDGDSDTKVLPYDPQERISQISTSETPPGGWQFIGADTSMNFDQLRERVSRLPQCTGKSNNEIKEAIIAYTIHRVPDWQNENINMFHLAEYVVGKQEPEPVKESNYSSLTGKTSP